MISTSDDRSAGSKIEEWDLLVLRGRAIKKLEHEVLPHILQTSLQHPAGLPLPFIGRVGTHAFQVHRMQLMLLEQQNKKRLLMARQEPKNVAPSISVAIDAMVVASVPTGIVSTTDTSKEFDGHNIKANLNYRPNTPHIRSKRPSSAPGLPSIC